MSQENQFEMEIENDDQPAPNQATDHSEANSMFDEEANRLLEQIFAPNAASTNIAEPPPPSAPPLPPSPLPPLYNPERNEYANNDEQRRHICLNSLFDRMSVTDRHGYSKSFALLPYQNRVIPPGFLLNEVRLPQSIPSWTPINEAASTSSEQSDSLGWVYNSTASEEEQPQTIMSLSQVNEAASARSEQTDSPASVKHPADSEDAV